MDTSQLLVTLIGAGGGGAAIMAIVKGTINWLSGAAGREKEKNTGLIAQRRKAIEEREAAEAEREAADIRRRKADEYSSQLRRILIEHGITPPKWYMEHEPDKDDKEQDG